MALVRHFDFVPVDKNLIDKDNVVHDVCVIQCGHAKGHNLEVTPESLRQFVEVVERQGGTTKVLIDHKSGVGSIAGYLSNFHISGEKVLADLKLLPEQRDFAHTKALIENLSGPGGIGLSASFVGEPDNGKVTVQQVVSVDLVVNPAVTNGLFSSKVDTANLHMAETSNPTVEQMLQGITAQLNQFNERLGAIELNAQDEEEDGLTEEEVAIYQEALNAGLIDEDGNLLEEEVQEDYIEEDGSDDPISQAFAALANRTIALEQQLGLDRETNEMADIEYRFSHLEQKIEELTAQRDAACELLEQYQTPGTPPSTMFDQVFTGTNDFNAIIAAKVTEGLSHTEAISFAIKNYPEAYRLSLEDPARRVSK
jgi:hypothetical protein